MARCEKERVRWLLDLFAANNINADTARNMAQEMACFANSILAVRPGRRSYWCWTCMSPVEKVNDQTVFLLELGYDEKDFSVMACCQKCSQLSKEELRKRIEARFP
jgi:hypothetical protein